MFRSFIAGLFLLTGSLVFAADEADAESTLLAENAAPTEEGLSAEEQAYVDKIRTLLDSLNPQGGQVKLPQANVTLNIPEEFYFLNAADSEAVLVDLWGNPPGQSVLGMILPAGSSPMDSDSWAVTIEYEEEGYVSDKDAADIDYADLLEQMQGDTREASKQRIKAGYEAVELVGWAAQPFYDPNSNKLHWAKEIKFGDSPEHTLNYNVRVLGRRGVLVMDFIAGMDQLPLIRENLDGVLSIAEFDAGSTYAEFDPEYDKVAAYGIGALVAGKVLAKSGFIAAAILFFKKFGVFIVLGIWGLIKALASRSKKA